MTYISSRNLSQKPINYSVIKCLLCEAITNAFDNLQIPMVIDKESTVTFSC